MSHDPEQTGYQASLDHVSLWLQKRVQQWIQVGAHVVSKEALAVVPDLMAGARASITQAVGVDSKE